MPDPLDPLRPLEPLEPLPLDWARWVPFLSALPLAVLTLSSLVVDVDRWLVPGLTLMAVTLSISSNLYRMSFKEWRCSKPELVGYVLGFEAGLMGFLGMLFDDEHSVQWAMTLAVGAMLFLWATGRSVKRDLREMEQFQGRLRKFMDENRIPGPEPRVAARRSWRGGARRPPRTRGQ